MEDGSSVVADNAAAGVDDDVVSAAAATTAAEAGDVVGDFVVIIDDDAGAAADGVTWVRCKCSGLYSNLRMPRKPYPTHATRPTELRKVTTMR